MATNIFSNRSADNFRIFRSGEIAAPADGQYNIIKIPRFALVKNVWVWVSTAFTDSGTPATLIVGWAGNATSAVANYFFATGTAVAITTGVYASGNAMYFNTASGYITVTTAKHNGTAGTFIVFADFTVIH